MSRIKKIALIVFGLFVLIVIIGALSSNNKDKAKTTAAKTPKTTQTKATTPSPSKPTPAAAATNTAAKQIADGISVQSTGYSQYGGKYHYGFMVNNTKAFNGSININLSGPNGSLSDAVVFTEKNLAAGAGDVGDAGWSGLYSKYSYTVKVDGQTYSYPGGSIVADN